MKRQIYVLFSIILLIGLVSYPKFSCLNTSDKPFFYDVVLDKEGQILGDGDVITVTCKFSSDEPLFDTCYVMIDAYSTNISFELYYDHLNDWYSGSYILGDTYDNPNRACYVMMISSPYEFNIETYYNESTHPFGYKSFIYNNNCKNGIHYPVMKSAKVDATCFETGISEEVICSLCETIIKKSEKLPATNHANATTDAGKEPTTTEVGYTAGKYCPDCETWLEGHEEIPMLHIHSYTPTITREPTCVILGLTTYTCSCGDSYTETMPVLSHEYYYKLEKSTLTKGGALHRICKNCNGTKNVEIYPLVNGFRLSDYEYTYNGKVKTPDVTVKDETGLVLVEGKDYTLTYESGRKNPGKYTVTVTLIGNYEGEKKLEFSILPGKTTSVSATQSTDSIKLTWKKVTGADGYRVYQYNSKTGKYEKIKTLTGTSYTVKKLKAGTTYKFAVKAYSKADGETLWAASSVSFKTATKPATPTVKATASSDKVTLKWNKVTGATGYVVYMQDEFGDYNKIGSTKNTSYSIKNLGYGETCRFRVVAYKKVDGKNIYGGYKTVKITVPYPAIYVTPSGKRYHYDKECAGKNATKTTLANAKKTRTPCKTCVL